MKRVILYGGTITTAAVVGAALAFSHSASTQSLPPASAARIVETVYASVGVSAIGNTGSVAWFVETNPDKERRPIACVVNAGNVECKRGSFPSP
jgi:hypothetical protein